MSEDTKDGLNGLAGEVLVPAPVVEVKVIPETIDSLEPLMRKTDAGVPIKLIEEVLSVPKEHVTVRCIVYPDNDQRTFTMTIRGDSMIPRYRSTHEGQIKHSEIVYKMPEIQIEAPVTLDAEGNKVVAPEVLERLAKARGSRKQNPEFTGIPNEINCTKCGEPKLLVKANVLKYAKADGKTVEEYLKTYECPACSPRKKGKTTNAKWLGLPKELHCSEAGCTFVKPQHPSATELAAKAAGVGFNEYIQGWKCKLHREHRPHHFSKAARVARGDKPKAKKLVKVATETNHRRGRVADPRWNGMAKELVCHFPGCKKVQPQHPSLTVKAAKHAGLSFEEFVGSWKCRKHRKEI